MSAAQSSIEDVLLMICASISHKDVAQAARVCRGWLPACRSHLYTDIYMETGITCRKTQFESLAATLSSNALLRGYIRRLTIFLWTDTEDSLCDWFALLPAQGVSTLCINASFQSTSFKQIFLRSPALRTIRHFSGRGNFFNSAEWVNQCLARMPFLESLCGYLPNPCGSIDVTIVPHLKRLSLLSEDYTPAITAMIADIPMLERFDLFLTNQACVVVDASDLLDVLPAHAPRLRHLTIHQHHAPLETRPILDELVPQLPGLRFIACGSTMYTSALFPVIPAGLETLQLEVNVRDRTFPFLAVIRTVRENPRASGISLSNLIIWKTADDNVPELNDVQDVCLQAGVGYTLLESYGDRFYNADRFIALSRFAL